FQVAYPVVPDPDFQLYHALGAGVTPFSVFVRRTSYGQAGVVAGTHTGLHKKPHQLLAELGSLVDLFPDELRARGPGQGAVPKGIAEVVSADELETRLMLAFTRFGGGAISAFQPLELASGRRVFLADTLGGKKQRRLFAEVVGRRNICDICHDVHFFYLFDSLGKVLAFEPLQLSKMGNKPWSREDVRKMRERLVGIDLAELQTFDAGVDAVTSATITSAVIFDAVSGGKTLMRELAEKGYLSN
ncbi:MAG: hypothetical protein JXK94_04700, partial [Deltaproteobacteria bacterium]|nr:hypothetical protein [Deltaproteobacteria bacterium]